MLDQEERLIELHSLLVALPALSPPGALAPWQVSAGLEVVGIPQIDGTTGGTRQITASDRTRAFPRPRAAVGLPAGGLAAFAGAAYVPPLEINRVSTHLGALEAGLAWRRGALAIGARVHGAYATSMSPVTDPATRDTLRTVVGGAEVQVAWSVSAGGVRLTPWAGAGVVRLDGRFRVTSDGAVLTARSTLPALSAGLHALTLERLEVAAAITAYPGRLVHPGLRLAWRF
jgi:hypothetical protein